MDLVAAIYAATAAFPKEENRGLTSHVRRAAVSMPSNVAEGQGRHGDRDFLNFLSCAQGSLREVETQILICQRLHFLPPERKIELMDLASEVGRLITGLANSLRREL